MDSKEALIDGTASAGYLMVRIHKGKREFRPMRSEEELDVMWLAKDCSDLQTYYRRSWLGLQYRRFACYSNALTARELLLHAP